MNKLKMNLQFFAETADDKPEINNPEQDKDLTKQEDHKTDERDNQSKKKYSDDEVNEIVNGKFAKWKKEFEKDYQAKLDEAEKLKTMNEKEKADYEKQKSLDRIAELEAQINQTKLEKEASAMLAESNIVATDEVLSFVVRSSAEETKSSVDSFVNLVNQVTDSKLQERLKGSTPKSFGGQTTTITKEQYDKMSYSERVKLNRDNRELYEELTKK